MTNHNEDGSRRLSIFNKNYEPNQQQLAHADSSPSASITEQDPFYRSFWDKLINKASVSPPVHDPVLWPLKLLNEFHCQQLERQAMLDAGTWRHYANRQPIKAALTERLAPVKEGIRKIATAYRIIAYPYCQNATDQYHIQATLASDQERHDRNAVELTGEELEVVRQLCQTPRIEITQTGPLDSDYTKTPQPPIPFDPQKRVYNYAEVLKKPQTRLDDPSQT
jgi:hypothetical protein